jgi:TolA-binding protein
MSACEVCQDRLVDFIAGDLPRGERRAVTEHLADCELCQIIDEKVRRGLAFAESLPVEEPPEEVVRAVLKAARVHSGEAAASATASTSMLPLSLTGPWARARGFLVRPQFVMATVMLLAVAFGAWYVPRRAELDRHPLAGGAATELAVAPAGPEPVYEEEAAPLPEAPGPAPSSPAEAAPALPTTAVRLERGLQAYGRSDYVAAIDALNAVVSAPDVDDGAWTTAMHHLARSYQQNGDCEAATHRYEQLFRRSPAYNLTNHASLEAGTCYRVLGSDARARELLELAAEDPATRAAAQAELERMGDPPRARRPSRSPSGSRVDAPVRPSPTVRPAGYNDAPF